MSLRDRYFSKSRRFGNDSTRTNETKPTNPDTKRKIKIFLKILLVFILTGFSLGLLDIGIARIHYHFHLQKIRSLRETAMDEIRSDQQFVITFD